MLLLREEGDGALDEGKDQLALGPRNEPAIMGSVFPRVKGREVEVASYGGESGRRLAVSWRGCKAGRSTRGAVGARRLGRGAPCIAFAPTTRPDRPRDPPGARTGGRDHARDQR